MAVAGAVLQRDAPLPAGAACGGTGVGREIRARHAWHGQRAVVECWIFSSAIEKGVLLRSRVLAAIGPTTGDLEWASGLATAFSASEPMLTA